MTRVCATRPDRAGLLDQLPQLWRENRLCDVQLQGTDGDAPLEAHRLVLCMARGSLPASLAALLTRRVIRRLAHSDRNLAMLPAALGLPFGALGTWPSSHRNSIHFPLEVIHRPPAG